MKNWKSTMAFFIFIAVYVYAVKSDKTDSVVGTTGYIALISSLAMVFRTDFTKEMLAKLIDKIRIGK